MGPIPSIHLGSSILISLESLDHVSASHHHLQVEGSGGGPLEGGGQEGALNRATDQHPASPELQHLHSIQRQISSFLTKNNEEMGSLDGNVSFNKRKPLSA